MYVYISKREIKLHLSTKHLMELTYTDSWMKYT